MLILARSELLPVPTILTWRLVLVAPLSIAAGWLATQAPEVALPLIAALVIRRAIEWLNEIHLSVAEVQGNRSLALWFLGGQFVLLMIVVVLLASNSHAFLPALFAWAVLPLVYTLPFLGRNVLRWEFPSRPAVLQLAGHSGSTAVSGLSLYAFRVLLLLVLGKAVAGDLFAAIAIGSFMGTLVANVLGPSVELHRARLGGGSLPSLMRAAVVGAMVVGIAITAASQALGSTPLGLGKSVFFWRAVGLSLLGGGLMVVAQIVRLRIVGQDDAREVLGPDVLVHLALLGAVPILFLAFGPSGLEAIYLVNAMLAYGFYRSAELLRGIAKPAGDSRRDTVVLWALPVFIFLPLFLQLTGNVYDAPKALSDSGGILRSLPLPISVIACSLAVLVMGRYAGAAIGYGFLFLAFALLTLSVIVSAQGHFDTATGKLLLLGQCVLPFLALPCGMQYADLDRDGSVLPKAILWLLIVLVPAQLLATWVEGESLLSHRVFVFSVYQHLQYVPVVLAIGYGIALNTLWPYPRLRAAVAIMAPIMGLYVMAALANLAIAAIGAAIALFLVVHRPSRSRLWHALIVLGTPLAMAAYAVPASINLEFQQKYPLLTNVLSARMVICAERPLNIARSVMTPGDGQEFRRDVREQSSLLIATEGCGGRADDVMIVRGNLRAGAVRVGVLKGGSWLAYSDVRERGPFRVQVPSGEGWVSAAVAYQMDKGGGLVDVSVYSFEFRRRDAASDIKPLPAPETPRTGGNENYPAPAQTQSAMPRTGSEGAPKNIAERFQDWLLFGKPIFSSTTSFLFGQDKPLDRSVRTSAHNYYIDTAFNFGMVGLVPVLGLLILTIRRSFALRSELRSNPKIASLLAAILFLAVIDSAFKVTLRQPYPGIAAFFLWGILLAHLRRVGAARQLRR
jgi:hypothetical protein